jgi:hypothetical protein
MATLLMHANGAIQVIIYHDNYRFTAILPGNGQLLCIHQVVETHFDLNAGIDSD